MEISKLYTNVWEYFILIAQSNIGIGKCVPTLIITGTKTFKYSNISVLTELEQFMLHIFGEIKTPTKSKEFWNAAVIIKDKLLVNSEPNEW